MKKRVVITGMGAITPIGNTVKEYWRSLLSGRSGVAPITLFDTADYPVKIAAEVKGFDGKEYFDRKDLRMMARPAQFGVASALMALSDAKWKERPGEGPLGVAGGISNSAQDPIESSIEVIQKRGYKRVVPTVLQQAFPHSTASEAGRLTGFQDQVMTFSTGCTSGMNSVGYAIQQIVSGSSQSFLCISTDAGIANYIFGFFCRSGMLSKSSEPPEKVSRPYDAKRDGGVLGEGAATFMVEDLGQAQRRGATVQAEILGWSSCGTGYRLNDSAEAVPQGMARSMRLALADANVRPEQIDYVGSHGVSDPHLDLWETKALKEVFGEYARRIPMSTVKSMIGIPQNAAGHLQAVAAIKAMNEGIIPPTINYENPDPECDLDYVPNKPRRNRIRRSLVFAHGFNGSDASLVLASPEATRVD